MKNNSICDERLITSISVELGHLGVFMPMTEIERSITTGYYGLKDVMGKASQEKLNPVHKTNAYYTILKNIACAELYSKTRLANARNDAERQSALILVQSYLDNVTKAMGLKNMSLKALCVDKVKSNKSCTSCKICSNILNQENILECGTMNCDDELERRCENNISITISYNGACTGIVIPTEIFGFDDDIDENTLEEKAKILENAIMKSAKELKKKSKDIFVGLYTAYKEGY